MVVLFVSTWFPYPLDNGSRLRVYHLIKALSQKHQVDLVAFLPPEIEHSRVKEVQSMCRQVKVIERDPFWRDPRKSLSGYFSWKPRDVIRGYSPEMAELVARMGRETHYDLIISSTTEVAPYCLQDTGIPKMLEEHNFMTGWMKERYQTQTHFLKRLTHQATWLKCYFYERKLYSYFDVVSMVSHTDQQAVRATFPGYKGRLEVIPNGVDLETRPCGLTAPTPETIVFNGALRYYANAEAMRFFCSQALPLIWQQRPKTRLIITGRYDRAELNWLPSDPRITMTGYLEDVRPAVAGAWMAVAPLLEGGGTRLKILEAMALGTPVVATSKGAEGLEVTPGKELLIANDAPGLADHCLRLLGDANLREEIARSARQLVEQHYNWQMIGERFCELVEQAATVK